MTPEDIQAARALASDCPDGPWRTLVPRLLDALEQAQAERDELTRQAGNRRQRNVELLAANDALISRAERAEAAVVEARKAALHEAADVIVAESYAAPYGTRNRGAALMMAAWLRARADAQGRLVALHADGSSPC